MIMKYIIAFIVVVAFSIVGYGYAKALSIYDEYVLLKSQANGIKSEKDRFKDLFKEGSAICTERVEKAIKRQKDLQDAKDKINNPNSGIVTLPLGM